MLEVGSISKKEKLYNFMAGLLLWVQNELRREKVKDLASAITVAESLMDFKGSSDGADKNKNSKGKKKLSTTLDLETRVFPKSEAAALCKLRSFSKGKVVGSGKELDESEAADTTGESAESLSFLTSCYILILLVGFRRSSCCWVF